MLRNAKLKKAAGIETPLESDKIEVCAVWKRIAQTCIYRIYYCQLKSDYIDEAENLKLGSIAKIKELLMSFSEFEQENTADLVVLYDCELTK